MLLWLKAFGLTLLLECPLGWALLRDREPAAWRLLGLLVFASLATHPLVWFVFPELPLAPELRLGLSEVWAWLAEALFLWLALPAVRWWRALLVALACNLVSFGGGLLAYRYLAEWMT